MAKRKMLVIGATLALLAGLVFAAQTAQAQVEGGGWTAVNPSFKLQQVGCGHINGLTFQLTCGNRSGQQRAEFRHAVRHTTDSLVRLVESRSMYLVADDVKRSRIERQVRELVGDLPQPFELPYVTVAFRAYAVATG